MASFTRGLYRTYPTRSTPSTARNLFWMSLGIGCGTMLALFLVIILGGTMLHQSQVIIPGVQIEGIDLGGLTTADATAMLNQQWQQHTIYLNDGETMLAIEPTQLGLLLDTEATIQAAYRQGRSPLRLHEWLKAGGEIEVSPVWRFDMAQAEVYLTSLTAQFTVEPVNATIRYNGQSVETVSPIMGRTLNVEATLAQLRQNMADVVETQQLSLVLRETAPIVTDVSTAVSQANQRLNQTITLNLYDPVTDEHFTWDVGPSQWGDWLTFSLSEQNKPELLWELNSAQIEQYLTTQADALGNNRGLEVDSATTALTTAFTTGQTELALRVHHKNWEYTVQYGDTFSSIAYKVGIPYPWIQQSNPNVDEHLTVGQKIIIPSADVMLPLPVVENKRIVVSLSEQTMWVYEDGQEKWVWSASTGIPSSPTAPGVFQIQTHFEEAYAENWDLWMPSFMGVYRPVPFNDFMNGIHGFPRRNGWQLLWTDDLGHPVTYGCILIDSEHAKELYAWADEGVIVEITP